MGRKVDLRSDTVTLPTEAMRERMCNAEVGDDCLDRDPTVEKLEALAASLMGMEAGLLLPSGTMGNLVAVMVTAPMPHRVLVHEEAHLILAEHRGAALARTTYHPLPGDGGMIDLKLLERELAAPRPSDQSILVCLESSHNNTGGTVLPLEYLSQVYNKCRSYGAYLHLDGARIFNAAATLGVPASDIAKYFHSVTFCLSKGLSAPIGSLLTGSAAMIGRARDARRILGAGMRQAGIIAAAGIEALETMPARLHLDHQRAARLATAINEQLPGFVAVPPQTNIVMLNVSATSWAADTWEKALRERGILTRTRGPGKIRCVLHRHIDDADVDEAVAAVTELLRRSMHSEISG